MKRVTPSATGPSQMFPMLSRDPYSSPGATRYLDPSGSSSPDVTPTSKCIAYDDLFTLASDVSDNCIISFSLSFGEDPEDRFSKLLSC